LSRSVLFLSYLFPPRGGAGVQRALKFAKYLPQFGWRPLVVANGGSAADFVTTQQDPTLLKDLPEGSVVEYTRLSPAEDRTYRRHQSKARQRLAATDPMGWWVGPAVRTGLELVQKHAPAAIFVTMSPFTAAEAGIRLKARTGLPLVFDLRDPWALDETRIYPTAWHARRDWRAMGRALGAADLVIMNTPRSAEAAAKAFPLAPGGRMIHLTNGFDPEDFSRGAVVPPAAPGVLRIVHTGMFHSELARVWDDLYARRGWMNKLKSARRPINLWSRTPRYLAEAMGRAVGSGAIPAGKVELVLVGELTASDRELIETGPAGSMTTLLGYRTHEESVGWVKSADLLFLPNHTPLDGGPALVVPGKTYEYLGSGRPVLSMGPAGDMSDFVERCRAGFCVKGDDVAAAADVLARAYAAKVAGSALIEPDVAAIAAFERRALAQRLAGVLDEVVQRPAGGT